MLEGCLTASTSTRISPPACGTSSQGAEEYERFLDDSSDAFCASSVDISGFQTAGTNHAHDIAAATDCGGLGQDALPAHYHACVDMIRCGWSAWDGRRARCRGCWRLPPRQHNPR
jgi:hypothetical protein